jgi:hypothetical protein
MGKANKEDESSRWQIGPVLAPKSEVFLNLFNHTWPSKRFRSERQTVSFQDLPPGPAMAVPAIQPVVHAA